MTDVVMPQMGESIVEGTLTKWLKKPGEHVDRDEPLFEISTDKVDTEIPSPAAGTLSEVMVEEGKTVGINTVVARIEENGAVAAPAAAQAAAAPQPAAAQPEAAAPEPPPFVEAPATPPPTVEETTAPPSPPVRSHRWCANWLARIISISAASKAPALEAASPNRTWKATWRNARPQPPRRQRRRRRRQRPPRESPPRPRQRRCAPAGPAKTRVEPLSTMRIKIAEHMVLSKRTSAHVTTIHRVDMTAVAKMRERNKAAFQANYGFSLTYLPFITRAAVVALRQFPLLNASLDGNNIIYHNEINIGIAVALENGLIVPVIRGADEKNVLGLQRAVVDLAARARSRQLKPDEVLGGTFSITNFGSFGSLVGTPIINQPQVAILGVGTVDKTPVVINDAIAIRSICHLSLSFDHRLIDGALADRFMSKLKQVLEGWTEEVQ